MSVDKQKVVVFGAGGLAGGELLRLLMMHPARFDVIAVSKSQAGKKVSQVHKAMTHLPDIEFQNLKVEDAVFGVDVVFLAMPHGQSQKIMKQIIRAEPKCVVDLANDFRIRNPFYFKEHFAAHSCPDLIEHFVYGLPEVFRDHIQAGKNIANPGCFATAAELALLPLAHKRMLPEQTAVFAVTGSSGSGINPKPGAHHPFRDGNLYAYKMLAHQHEPEIGQTLSQVAGEDCGIRLLAHSGPFVRGIHATAYLNDPRFAGQDLMTIYKKYFESHPFVKVLDYPPDMAVVCNTNYVHVYVEQRDSEAEVVVVIDNLIKGAAGQAIQNMNLVLGLPESDGLTYPGSYPC